MTAEVNPEWPWRGYPEDVIEGRIQACDLTKLACERSLHEHDNGVEPWVWDADFAIPVVGFFGWLHHVTGDHAKPIGIDDNGKPVYRTIDLEPWQAWVIGEIYGWRARRDLNIRRFTEVLIEVAKKNGKTLIGSGISLYHLLHQGSGQEIYSVASKRDQAKIIWDIAGKIAERSQEVEDGICEGIDGNKSELRSRNGIFAPLSKEAKSLDGPNPSVLLVDEAAVITGRDTIEKLTTAMAARIDPLTVYMTTAQTSRSTPYYEVREMLRNILQGNIQGGDRMFGCIWALDKEEEIWDETAWVKANPNLGKSVQVDTLRKAVAECQITPAKRSNVLRLNFNMWMSSETGFVDMDDWVASRGEIQREGPCWMGVDLAETNDLAAVVTIWSTQTDRVYVEGKCFTNRAYVDKLPDHRVSLYEQAIESGVLQVCEGKSIDFDTVEEYIREQYDTYDARMIGFDRAQALRISNNLEKDDYKIMLVSQRMSGVNEATRRLAALIGKRGMVHNGDPFITWQLENCVLVDKGGLWKVYAPATDESAKIDYFSALVDALVVMDPNAEPETDANIEVWRWDD